ncbi:uncharacterized protein J8A68_000278 [[Candida] subhashii]|uniref:LCCL domain-containing protein n=1 Tax=[Candida] subhashii TaxID=561895 RepID=A0A8J5UUZ1_9ASCO|nr:uncharacterized protein J8A68_000278 [[Candida] subhashii]KAG7666182.1 hypothetical protein J8A68_000278 [[Candida] subhashii]
MSFHSPLILNQEEEVDPNSIPLNTLPSRKSSTSSSDSMNSEDLTSEASRDFFSHTTNHRSRIHQFFNAIWYGPQEPIDDPAPRIHCLESLEEFPDSLKRRIPLPLTRALLVLYLIFWFGLNYSIIIPYLTKPPYITANPDIPIVSLSCGASYQFWKGKNGACGLDSQCPEVESESDVIFRCPALCDQSKTYSFMPVGDMNIKYRGYFIGGGAVTDQHELLHPDQLTNPYRADSYPCGSAVHAGLVSPFFGGCARISYDSKSKSYFPAAKGKYGVGDSIEFLSFFKSSFYFKTLKSGLTGDSSFVNCYDPRLLVLAVNVILGIPIVYLCSGKVTYWTISTVGFWTSVLTTDPPVTVDPRDPEDFAYLLSVGFERFLPTCFILYVLWRISVKVTLSESTEFKISPLSRVLLWYPLFWIGLLNNMTFDRLPVDRFTISDLQQQAGAIFAVGFIISLISICAIIQAYKIWLAGKFRRYLVIYIILILSLVFLGSLSGLTLRVHHYILAILLIPGCATKGRTALMFQGILLGLFISGVARWGMASIVETAFALKRDDPKGKIIPPQIMGYHNDTGILNWKSIPDPIASPVDGQLYKRYSSVSILINDIEQYVGNAIDSVNLRVLFANSTELSAQIEQAMKDGIRDGDGNISIFIRIGRKIPNSGRYSDFSRAMVLKWPSGDYILPMEGLT